MKWLRKKSNNRLAKENKKRVAKKYIFGTGIEIGALHNAMPVAKDVKVKYLDRLSYEDYLKEYPELKGKKLIKTDIVDNAETLQNVHGFSQDFIIASHIIEHLENPILAIHNFYRILKNKGLLFLVVPDKNYCFDINRNLTEFSDIVRDYEESPETSRKSHYIDWVKNVKNITGEIEILKEAERMELSGENIHFHVWESKSFLDFITKVINKYNLGFEIIYFEKNYSETIVIIQKT